MGHHGNLMISPTEVMVDLECSPLSNSLDMGRHLEAHLEVLQHRLETIQSFGCHHPRLLHQDNCPAHLGDPPLASQQTDFSRLWNRGGQMMQGFPICPHYQPYPMTNTMNSMGATIRRTWAEGKVPISLKQTEFSLKQFGNRMRQPILSAFNKWKKRWVAGYLEKKHLSGIGGQYCFEQLRHRRMCWKTAVAQLFETFETRLPLDTIDHDEWIWRHWVGKVLKNCPSEVREARNKGRRVNKRLATDLHELTGKIGRCNLQESPNTTLIVVIR